MSEITLSEINIFPVKSFAGISLSESVVDERGLQHDRRRMLINEHGEFMTQREHPKMALLSVGIENGSLGIFYKGNEVISASAIPDTSEKIGVTVWNSKCKAEVYPDEVNAAISETLGVNCRMVYMADEDKRIVNPIYAVNKFKDVVSFADGYPVLLIGEGSLADLNSRLEKPVPMNRFRPNLVVKNTEAFAEDTWKKIRIGETTFHLVKPCARCVITTVDQARGEFTGADPLRTLAAYRTVRTENLNGAMFGQNLIAENFGEVIKVGDKVEILEVKK